jgi:FdhD protein
VIDPDKRVQLLRRTWASSSCGLCGKATLDELRRHFRPISSSLTIEHSLLAEFPHRMRQHQSNFNRTGGIHAAALFDVWGRMPLIREDLGRHNAVDKVLGAAMRAGTDAGEMVLLVSGRLGFEIAQKAAAAGISIIASVSAPSSLAVELTTEFGITAAGFVRDGSMNIYSHPQRILNGVSKHSF